MAEPSFQQLKIVVVGPNGVGKSSLLISYTTNAPPADGYIPTVLDVHTANVIIDGHPVVPYLWDTAGGEDYDRLRPLSYPHTDVVLVCFSVVHPASFEKAKEKYVAEIKHHIPAVPFMLVGLKHDLLEDQAHLERLKSKGQAPITEEQMRSAAKELGAYDSIMCSSHTMYHVKQTFDNAINRGGFVLK